MSALALYSYRMTSGVRFIHTVILLVGMAVYYSLASGNSIPLFNSGYDKRVFIAVFLLFSLVAGLVTLFISSRRREK
jgi:hypothetical protein